MTTLITSQRFSALCMIALISAMYSSATEGAYVNVASQTNGGVATATGTGADATRGNNNNFGLPFLADFSSGGVQWQVVFNDLAGSNLDYLRMVPRQDCCQDRLDNYKVEFFDNTVGGNLLHSFTSTTQAPNDGAYFGLASEYLTTARRMVVTDMQPGISNVHFNFAEAQLFANASPGPYNVALNKPATATPYSSSFPASNGNDSNLTNFSHGPNSTTAFWEVDLLDAYNLDYLEITSRSGFAARTNGATVTLFSPYGGVVDSFVLGGFTGGDTLQFNNGGNGWNDVARIRVQGVAYLHVGELVAFGLAVPEPSSYALGLMASLAVMGLMWQRRRRSAAAQCA